MNKSKIIAIIPAAGIGERMNENIPKQYLKINDKTVIEYSLDLFLSHKNIEKIIVAIHPNDHFFATLPCSNHPKIQIVFGGNTRAESVLSALKSIENSNEKWCLVHDAARPCLTKSDLDLLINSALAKNKSAILAFPIADTIKKVYLDENKIQETIPRNELWRALTPQIFPIQLLKMCLIRALNSLEEITDDSSALEFCGFYPLIIQGKSSNIKITWQGELELATFFINQLQNQNEEN